MITLKQAGQGTITRVWKRVGSVEADNRSANGEWHGRLPFSRFPDLEIEAKVLIIPISSY
jgi:hypothetical protein